ncbi:MAG: isoprenylcysteine carboxylmethyltransferase family protein, partial [Alphaproteobacteria bacterium]|nr:isoprenylcysteine carboxylmethyltransferase family protein [Alphaproteobacteria bacterium]
MAQSDDVPRVVAPPPVLLLIALAVGVGLELVLPTGFVAAAPAAVRFAVAAAVLGLSGALGVGGIVAFRRARTAVEPWHPTTALVTSGVYGRVRNPMYLGLVLITAAVALAAASDGVLLATGALAAVLHYGVVRPEERYL